MIVLSVIVVRIEEEEIAVALIDNSEDPMGNCSCLCCLCC